MLLLAALLLPAPAAFGDGDPPVVVPQQAASAGDVFCDVSSSHWAAGAIAYVGRKHGWMRDFGSRCFKPKLRASRRLVASALVKAFAPNERTPKVKFKDLKPSDKFYRYAAIAVKKGWIKTHGNGRFGPKDSIKVMTFDRALVLAKGLARPARALAKIRTKNGHRFKVRDAFPYLQLAKTLALHYNHDDEGADLMPSSYIPRAEVAWALWRAKTENGSRLSNAHRFAKVAFPKLRERDKTQLAKRRLIQFGLKYVGYPYWWGGEWDKRTPRGYCCGAQSHGGFDCSGFVWWVMKSPAQGYDNTRTRPYRGWSLPERTSSTMARYTRSKVRFDNLRIGDLMFFASNGGSSWGSVDHVGIYAGNNWMIHSGSGNGGVALEWVAKGWYRDNFVYGRRLIGVSASQSLPHPLTEDLETAGG